MHPPPHFDLVIVGAGIVGLATARQLLIDQPTLKLCVIDKEAAIAQHQSSHNSGVIHAGIYYAPGSQRAQLCRVGVPLMYEYCEKNRIPYKKVGKLIVAVDNNEVEALEKIYERGIANGVPELSIIDGQKIRQLEPNIAGVRAIVSPSTGIVNFADVAKCYARDIQQSGGTIMTGFQLTQVHSESTNGIQRFHLQSSTRQTITTTYAITCAGVYADRIARLFGGALKPEIVPVRGTWLQMKREYSHLVHQNIYPVPNPAFPFLGVHLTPTLDGTILIGPNAVLALSREGYDVSKFDLKDIIESLRVPGLQALIKKYWKFGLNELSSDLFPQLIALANIKRYMPSLTWNHLMTQPGLLFDRPVVLSGVRAQAIGDEGKLIEDFVFESQFDAHGNGTVLHVRNAPSPAATSSLTIAGRIVEQAKRLFPI